MIITRKKLAALMLAPVTGLAAFLAPGLATAASASPAPVAKVAGLHVTASAQASLTVAWTAPADRNAKVRVQVYDADTLADTYDTAYKGGDIAGKATVTATGLAAGTAYELRADEYDGTANSGWTAPVTVYTAATGSTGTAGPAGPAGPQGPAGTPSLFESTGFSTPALAIDMAPGPDGTAGSGGWGWDATASKPVTSLTAGTESSLTVTLVQPGTETADGSVTLTYDPYDFKLTTLPADGTCAVIAQTAQEACSFTDLAHSAKSVAFGFTPQHADPDAVVGVAAVVAGQEAAASFPVQLQAAS